MSYAPSLNAPTSATSPSGNQPASIIIAEQVGRSLDALAQPYRVDVVGPHLGTSSTNQRPSSAEITTFPGGAIAIEIKQGIPMMGIPWEIQDNQPEELSTATLDLSPSGKLPMGGLWLPATVLQIALHELGMKLASLLSKDLMRQNNQSRQVIDVDFDGVRTPPRSSRPAVMEARYMGRGKPRPFEDILSEE